MDEHGPASFDEMLTEERDSVERAFREGWTPEGGAGLPRSLTVEQYEEFRKIDERDGWTGLDPALFEAVRGGARPGDALPPLEREPLIRFVHDVEVRIVGTGPD